MYHRKQHLLKPLVGAGAAAALMFGLVACAPEPGEAAGSIDKEKQTTSPETEWGGQDQPEEVLQTTLPESFPVDMFVAPAGSEVYNTGERGADQWFLVLRAADAVAATTTWDAIVATNGFVITDQVETTEGGVSATLSTATLTVQALTIPQNDGSVLLNYDLQRMAE
jgi:hypothetical protein